MVLAYSCEKRKKIHLWGLRLTDIEELQTNNDKRHLQLLCFITREDIQQIHLSK